MPHYQYNNEYYDIPSEKAQEFEAEFPDATVDVSDGNGNLYSLPVAKLREFKRDFTDWSYSPISPDVANSWQFKLGAKMAENLKDDSSASEPTRTDATLASPDASSPSSRTDATQQFSTLHQAPEDTLQWLDTQNKQRQNKLNSQNITNINAIQEQKSQLQQKYKDILNARPARSYQQRLDTNLPKDATYYWQAIAMLDDAQHTLDTAHNIPNSNPIQNFGRGAARGLFNINTLTLGLAELLSNTTLLGILDKADSKGIEALSDAEEALINAAIVKQVVDSSTDLGRSYLFGRGFTENLPYMIEFALSGIPAGALTKGAGKKITNVMAQLARKAAEKTTSRFMRGAAQQGTKFATGLAKGSLRAAAQLPLQSSTYNTLAERKIGQLDYADDAQGNLTYIARNNEDTPEALAKTVASAFTTNLVETFGGNVIADLAALPIRGLANSKAWQSLSRSLRQNKLVQFAQAAGYQGSPVEFFEEMIDSSLNAIITGDQSLADVYAPDNIINTAGVTLLTSLFIGSAAGITTSRTRSRVNREYTQASNDIVSAGYTPTQIEQLTDIALGTPTQVSNWLAGITGEINTLIQQSSTDGSLDDSAQSAQRIRQLISQRDFVLASAQYQALIGGMRDNIRPAIDAATQAINAQAHEQSGYTIKVFINNKALNGYLHSGNIDVTTLPDGTPQVNLNANIYQVAVPRDNGEIDIIQATPQDIVIQQAVPTETVLRQGLDAINQPLNELIAQDLQQAVEQQQTPQTVGEGVNQDDTSSPSPDAVPNDPNKPTDTSSLSDTDFDAHIDSLTPAEAISAIANRRGADDADQYANWKKAALTKQRDAAQKKLTRERKPFDASRYPSFNEMKAAERQYNTQIEQEKQDLNAQIATLNAQLADIEAYLIDRNKQIAAEREAENPLQGGIAQAVRKQPINTLEQYIAREIALGARLRLSDNTGNGLAAELGITPGSQEHRELLSILSNTEGLTPEQWAEYIIENIEPEYAHLINGRDTQDIRNAIIDTIHAGVTSRRRAYQFIADINQQQADAERQYYENAQHNADTDTDADATLASPSDTSSPLSPSQQTLTDPISTRRDATLASPSEEINQADIDADTEQAIREYEELLLSSLSPNDIAIIDAMTGDYWDELQAIYQYEQEAYNNYDTNSTRPTPQDNLSQRENATIQPSQETSNSTPVRQHSNNVAENQPQSTAPNNPRSTRTDVVDNVSKTEFDEDGLPFILSSTGSTTFGEITENTGLTPAPIKLSLGNSKYGLTHIEKRHGEQIRNAGFASVEEFVEYVCKNYKQIKQGENSVGEENGTYLIQIEDTHNNTLYIELSTDGNYWGVNSGGVFRNGYGNNKKEVWSASEVQSDNSAVVSDGLQSEPIAENDSTSNGTPSNISNSKDTNSSPISNNFNEKIAQASADVNTKPTEAQKEAGNYKKGHVKIGSFDITIEHPKGSVRSGVDADGNKWETTMQNTYGYIRGTEGVDGDHIDVFLSNDLDSWNGRRIYVVDQYNKDGSFDEHKVMLGFNDSYDAEEAYTSNYNKDWQGQRAITSVSLEEFEKWLASSHRKTKPFAHYRSVQSTEEHLKDSFIPPASDDVKVDESESSTRTDETLASPSEGINQVDALQPSSPSTPSNQGQFNLVSDERMDELRERLRRKLRGQINIGIDPEILSIGLEIAVGHIDRGIKSFTDFARVMIDDLGDTIRPYLKAFYNGARDLPEIIDNGLANDMTPYNDVQQFDVANFLRPGIDPIATAQTIARETEVAQQAETAKQRIKNTNKKKKSLPSQGNQLNLFDNDTRTKQDSSTDNRGTQPRPGEISQTQSVESRTPLQHPVEISRSERGNARISSSQSGDRPLYDVNKNYTNDEIAQIVSSVTDIVDGKVVITGDVTDDIKAICRQYKSGGVAKKGRGILDEYYTDGKIVDAVNLIIAPYFKDSQPVRVLEPSVGIGNFIGAVDNIPTSQVVAFEINDTTARIAKILHPQVDINLRSFETEFIDEAGGKKPLPQKFNLIIGNPPYGSHRGLYKGLGEESKIARYEDYFVKRSLDILQEGGILAMVLPSSWLDRHSRFGGYTIEAAYRLPSGAFEATEVGTDIVVLRKDSSVPVTQHTPYFEQHPDRILGDIKQRKGRYGHIEQYVEGNIDTAIEAIKREQAEHLAAQLNIAPTNDNINNIQNAIDETGSTEKATPIIETEKSQTPANKPSNPSSKYKVTLKRGGETVPTSQQFSHPFSEGEVEAFADTDYDGTISNPTKHRKYANFIGGRFVHDFYYAEGNIYDKLAQLEQEKDKIIKEYGKEQYDKQKRLLESVLPNRKGLNEITISPNTTFVKNLQILTDDGRIPLKDMFIEFCRKLPYQAFGSSSAWEVIGYVNNEQVYGQDKQRNQLIRDRRKKAANDLFIKFLNEELSDDAKRQVVAAFNREYNSTYRPDYSRVPMFSTINKDFKGKPLKLTSVQLAGIGRMTVKGVGLLAHEVGFGKTLSGILAMHEAMTRGFATKPLIVVPNDNILKQWVETINDVLPQATVNSLGNLGTNYDLTDFKINDGEFTIVTYEGLKAMSFSDDTYNRLAQRFSYITEDLNKHQSERDYQKELEKRNELKGKMRRGAKKTYNFEDFGFDWLTVDEVHNANHIVSKVRLDKSIASDFRSQGQRTSDLGLKTWLAAQYIQEENNGRNVLLLSATPFTNKPLEYYSILSLIANDMLRRKGFFNVDQFFETFMEADNELEIAANGKPVQKTNIRRFRNNGLFQQLLSEFIDIKGEEDNPDLVRPTRHNKEYKIAQNELTEQAIAASQDLLNDNDTVLQGIGHARAAAFSPYATSLLGERPRNYREFVNNSPKIDATIKMIEQNKKDRPDAGQIIYSEVGVEFFPMIRDYLVNVSGFKTSEVRIITGATSNDERINIQSAFNNGEVKVVIGSPAIKEGLNLQENTTDMYILSLPWNFTQLRQIEGRGWRQGNKWENIRINYMLTNDSVDVFMLQRLQLKQGLYNEAMKSGAESLDVSDIDTSELKTALITDPDTRADIVTKQTRNKLENEKTQIEADLSFVLRKFEAYNKLLKKFEEKKNEIKLFKEWAAGGNTYWAERISSEENKLTLIERDIQDEKINLQKKGVNVDEITRQTEQAQKAIEQINEKIENLKDFKESLANQYRKEREEKENSQGDVIANYLNERKAENNSGFYKIRPKQTLTDSKDTNQSSSDIPERIRDKFSFRELDDTTNSSSNSNWSPEEQSIIDQARNNGTYLLAPNGRPTNLTPRQWVQVRTRAFKQWFGDWQKAVRIEKLRNSEPIEITGSEIEASEDIKTYRDNAKKYGLALRGEYTNVDTGNVISLSKGSIKEVTSHDVSDEQLQSVAAIPQIIENSVYIDTVENTDKAKHPDVASYDYYVCGLKIGGVDYTVKAVIANSTTGERYYDHKLTQIEKGKLISLTTGITTPGNENNSPLSGVKDKRLLSILQTNASKIVDENGEPRVMYHGTDADITTFFMQDGSLGRGAYFTSNWDEAAEYAKSKQGVEDIEDLDENKVLEVFLNVRDEGNITHSRFYREDIEVLATTPNQIKSATDNIGSFDNRFNDIRFRTSSPLDIAQQVVAQDMPRRIAKRAKQLADKLGVNITIINTYDDLRQINDDYAYLADWIEGKIDGQTRRYAGLFSNDDNRIIIFANVIRNLQDPLAEVEKTITHEVVAHYGLRRLLGEEGLANFLSDVWQSLPTEKQLRWGKYAMNIKRTQTLSPTELAMLYSDKQLQQKAAEEYIANISEQGVTTPTLWQRICAAFRRIMRRLGFYNYTPTEADIRYILSLSYRNLRRDAGTPRTDATLTSQAVGEGGNFNLSTVNFQSREVDNSTLAISQEIENLASKYNLSAACGITAVISDKQQLEYMQQHLGAEEYNLIAKSYNNPSVSGVSLPNRNISVVFTHKVKDVKEAVETWVHETTHILYEKIDLPDKQQCGMAALQWLKESNDPIATDAYNNIIRLYDSKDWADEATATLVEHLVKMGGMENFLNATFTGNEKLAKLATSIQNLFKYGTTTPQKTGIRLQQTDRPTTGLSGRSQSPSVEIPFQSNNPGRYNNFRRGMGRENTSDTGTQQRQVISDFYIADNTLSTLDDIAEQYNLHLDEQRQASAEAITPQPTDDPITTAQKVRFREAAEFVTRDNTAYEQFLDVANDISDAINENDARHGRKRTTVAEAHYDSMQRLKNLIDDIGTKQTNNNPYITQNQARSRAQALTRIFNATHLPEIYDAVTNCLQALNPNIDWKNKDQVDKQYNLLSIYLQARTALERQAIKEEAARAEAEANGEEYIERDFAGLAGVQTAIFDLYDQYDETVKVLKRDREKLAALAQDREVPTVQEFVDRVENYAGNNQSPINSLWKAIQKVSEFQLDTSYEAGVISRSGYQTLTYGVSIDNLLKQRYEEQRKAIIDHPGNYDNVTDYDKEGNATGTRKQLNSKAQQDLYNLANEYAEAVKKVPMPTNTQNDFQRLIETGWLTAEEVASFHRYYQYYTPLKGHAELTAEDVVEYEQKTHRNQSKVKSVQGHTQLAKDPLNQLILDTHGAIQSAEQNRWRRDLYNLLSRNPNSKQYTIQQRYYRVETNINGDKELVPYGTIEHDELGKEIFVPGVPTPEELANGTAVAFNNRNTEAKVDIPIRRSQRDEHTVTVLVDGEPYSIFFFDKRIADAVNGRNIKHPRDIWRALEKLQGINRLYAGLKTSLNPTFTLISNLPRDWAEMTSNNFIAHGAQHALTSFIYRLRATWVGDVQRAVSRYQSGELVTIDDAKTETERYVMEFITNGGQVNITQLPDYEDARVNLAKDLQYFARKGKMPKGFILARIFNNMAERVELAPRLATYIASRKIGLSIAESINDAKEATVNFDRKGSWSGIMGLFQLFYNASAQSVRRQIQLAKKHPIRFTATYAVIGLSTTINNIMISWLLSSLLAGDDEDKKHSIEDITTKYFAVNPELRRHYNVIMLGDTYIRIPMAINYLPYVTLGDVLADTFLNPNSRKQHLKNSLDVTSAILDTFSPSMIAQPIGFAFDAITARDNRVKESAIQAMTMSALNKIPVIEPLVQSFGNYNFMGGTLYDTPFNRNTTQPAYIEARAYTQPIWILASRTLNNITGGNEVRAGWANIPAESIENVMSIFGGFGEYGENIASLAQLTYEAATGSDVKASDWIKSSLLISRLYGGNANERYDKAMQSLFYDDMSALAKFNEYRKNADTPELMEDFNREYSPDEQRYFADLNTMQRIHNVLKREERAKQNAAASDLTSQNSRRYATLEGDHSTQQQALYELANTQFQSLASGHYQPVNDPYYIYMYMLDAIRNTPYTTQTGEVVNIGSLNKSERKQLLKNDKEMLDMLNLLDDVKEDFADIDKKYYPGKQLDDKQQRLYDQRLPRIVRRTRQLTDKYNQLNNNKSR